MKDKVKKTAKKIVTVDSSAQLKSTALKSLSRAFKEDIEDTELLDRYKNFQRNLEHYKERYNELVPIINEKLESTSKLRKTVIEQAMEGVLAKEAVLRIKEIEKEIVTLRENIADYGEKMEYNKNLVELYKKNSDDRLFVWWKAFKAVDSKTTASWSEWKKLYEKVII